MKEQELLYNFIVNNHNLEILESHIKVFNPFRILKIENYEIRHSNVLAWLLNPNENHGLNDYFLKKVISQIILENEETFNQRINLLDIHLAEFGDSIVRREEHNIDILLISKRNKILLIIENKIHSKESKYQLTNYVNYAKNTYHDYTLIPILLTKTGDEPENNDEFGIFSHESIHRLISETLSLKREYLTSELASFIDFYLKTLEKTLGMNEDLKELCLKIYNEHKEAIDLIFETIGSNETSLKEAFNNFISNRDGEIHPFDIRDKELWFLPTQLMNKLPRRDVGWRIPFPIAIWISKRDDERLKFHIEIGPFISGENRLRFVNYLEEKGYSIRNSAKRLESKYTRIHTNHLRVKDWSDPEELIEAVEKIYRQNNKEVQRIIDVVGNYPFESAEYNQ